MKSSVTELRRATTPRAQSGRGVRPGGRRAGRPPGRAWLNAREVGGVDPRWAHLGETHD
ncbi:MAG: hypothetical protein JW895_12845 [Thermoleophilaceae bacterium]|nr:hypothetical protein [Thermoleophilaceae bacterium]